MVVPHMVIRQEAQVITQTVELPSTTYTTHVTLGVVSAAATDRPVAVPSQHSGDGLSGAEIGAIVGAVVGFFILSFVVVCCCCRRPRKQVKIRRSYRSYSGSEDDWSVVMPHEGWTRPVPVAIPRPVPVQYPPPAAQREQVPGGPKFPTYRAIPIPNPRRAASNLPRTYR
ncbi:hypothetical protein SNK03_007797 [Fusarium graminearum]|uniref:Chromosome 4, complete genome n=1 Tax=Gibberella zeae (strain ATCC MYA-4620 / CBS 123657 / FGSC 9075 / NRRL 31084 / PH-1) TaxID=229533 RepID=A0A0E0S9J8_GIBZE|nr:hypothetical protein FG05_06546 [Fusarium graminearum]PCD20003.1 hypothetical protein FGRA07_05752 [Fusarium graminearum]CAF3471040.1 unnamed protein product [Fusarium graminearum]CAG1978544.1 unnamed protein product [Fusarium graminearum]CEF83111.1 unnamed protein product [Fusarium graminearum]